MAARPRAVRQAGDLHGPPPLVRLAPHRTDKRCGDGMIRGAPTLIVAVHVGSRWQQLVHVDLQHVTGRNVIFLQAALFHKGLSI
jgi:hypothetical protein